MFTDNIKVLTETLHGKKNNRNILNMSQAKQVPYHHGKILTDEDVDGKKKYPDYCRTMTIKDANGVIRELVFPRALDLDRPKRSRTTFSREQLYYLEGEFQKKQYLVGKERSELANQLRLTETQVKVWFQNRRTKYKRDRERKTELKDMKESFGNGEFLKYLQPPSQPCACFPYLSCQQYPYTSFSPM